MSNLIYLENCFHVKLARLPGLVSDQFAFLMWAERGAFRSMVSKVELAESPISKGSH